MRSFALLAALMGAAMAAPSTMSKNLRLRDAEDKGYSIANPGNRGDIIVDSTNTLNGTVINDKSRAKIASTKAVAANGTLDLALVNNFGGGAINAYIQGQDPDGGVVFVGADGSLIYPTAGGSATPVPISDPIAIPLGAQGETTNVNIPISMSSGRVYFCEGELPFYMVQVDGGDGIVQPSVNNLEDPSSALNWGFVELTYTELKAIYANISYVDFVGLILSMRLDNTDGSSQETVGLDAGAVTEICDGLVTQAGADSQPWGALCVANDAGVVNRVISPRNLADIDGDSFTEYWNQYADDVWTKYTNEPLTINSQNDAGLIACQVSGDTLTCEGDNRGYSKPTAVDIWGCDSGPFGKQEGDNAVHLAVIPRLCAAFTRTTLLLDGGATQPSLDATNYYTVDPTSHYARLVHQFEVDGKGYAYPYDDVNPDGNEDASGLVSSGNPQLLTVWVGGKPSA